MFHSQHQIEKYLQQFFHKPGFFLEIGCWDGELISQTAWLEREKNWFGLCVDPFPRNFEKRSCRVCTKAISGKKGYGRREFVKVSIDRRDGGDVSYFSGFTENVKAHWDLISKHCNYQIVQVPTITMSELYELYRLPAYIEFLSVDVEGSELEIFESIDFNSCSFGLIVFEHNEDETVRSRVGELLRRNGYHLLETMRCDDIYLANKIEEPA